MSALPKLLYILPDLAYVAELLPTKKTFTYAIHNFRQINGDFLDDNELIEANIGKLLDRLDVADYIVVLPDYLFTDTIVNVRADSETKVKEYLKSQLLPGLEIDKATHQIETFILTEFKGMFKVQLSALERSVITPLSRAMMQRGLTVHAVVSLSWSAKSIISLEPSVSVLQMGEKLYVAQHYIGIDQTSFASVLESTNVVDAIKTLKGAEPSIQTVYVLASEVVAGELKDSLRDIVPVQQLALFNETDGKMPSFVKQIIESGMRTLTAPDYMVPRFSLEKVSPAAVLTEDKAESEPPVETIMKTDVALEESETSLPKPSTKSEALTHSPVPTKPEPDLHTESIGEPTRPKTAPATPDSEVLTEESANAELEKLFGVTASEPTAVSTKLEEAATASEPQAVEESTPEDQSMSETTLVESAQETLLEKTSESDSKKDGESKTTTKTIIKNKTDDKNMVKLVFIGLASFFATIGIGIGLGLGIMMVSNKKPTTQTTVIEPAVPSIAPSASASATPAATASATKTATKSAAVKQSEKVLVVNATKITGYAGKIATKLQTGGYVGVKTGNAKGTYEAGLYILQRQKNETVLNAVTKASGLTLKTANGMDVEDPSKQYDVVVVLAE